MHLSAELEALVQRVIADPQPGDDLALAVRSTLDEFARLHPGRSVELRVPPYRAVQILGGTTHKRGTPPAVVEMSAITWLRLLSQELTWPDAIAQGHIHASGVGSDLTELFIEGN